MADDPTTPTPDAPTEPTAPTDDPALGAAGEKALDAWKARAKAAEADAKRAKDLEAEVAALKAAQMSDHEKAIDAARKEAADQARTEALGTVNERLLKSELKAATAGQLLDAAAKDLLVDTDVALKLLGLDEIPVTDSGDIDGEAISQAVAAYVTARPHLAASATLQPGIDQGSRTAPAGAKSLDERIADAEAAGNHKLSMSLKTQKLVAR